MLSLETGFLLNVIAERDGSCRVVELRTLALHCGDRAHGDLGVREDGRLAVGVGFKAFQRIVRSWDDVHLTAPNQPVRQFLSIVYDVRQETLVIPDVPIVTIEGAFLHGQRAVCILVVGVRADLDIGIVMIRQRQQIVPALIMQVSVVLRGSQNVTLDLSYWWQLCIAVRDAVNGSASNGLLVAKFSEIMTDGGAGNAEFAGCCRNVTAKPIKNFGDLFAHLLCCNFSRRKCFVLRLRRLFATQIVPPSMS